MPSDIKIEKRYKFYLARHIQLVLKGKCYASLNPVVRCTFVKDNKIIKGYEI